MLFICDREIRAEMNVHRMSYFIIFSIHMLYIEEIVCLVHDVYNKVVSYRLETLYRHEDRD